MKDWAKIIALLTGFLFYIAIALAPTILVIWIVAHFVLKYW